ncbi:MAG: hypothetical protein IKI21_10155, partial [Oscillospiraceae bacterium]|nr:hypothetical protein [Oscillospiraceae bacterium]
VPAAAAAKTVVQSQGSETGDARMRGSGAAVVHDDARGSDVLSLSGNGFGTGWLELPPLFQDGCADGFTFSMAVKLAADTADYSRLFQFATVPFGTGNAPSYNSPDLSVDVKDKSAFRASVFAGTGSVTVNDQKHRAIFDLDAAPDTDWHTLTVVYAPGGVTYYLDGAVVSYTAETADAAAASLFEGDTLAA